MSLDIFGALTGIFVIVYDGQHALRFTLGRARSIVGPGIHFKVPLFQTFKVEETKHTTLDLEPQVIQLNDNLVYEVDCKVVYQIVNLRKAMIEVDDLVTGLQNRVVIAVQQIVSRKDRHTVLDVDGLCEEIREELRGVEDQWGVRILQFGFSNISPSPTTLEITQLELLAEEKLNLYSRLRDEGLSEEASVALISGAVVSVHPEDNEPSRQRSRAQDTAAMGLLNDELDEGRSAKGQSSTEPDPLADPDEDPLDPGEPGP
ncbi:MAG TPA: SPFH domain-containing protein [Planctomycetota bacterium]|jgi:regulator of protease activity HflC (stomatin/prohibitin superfamily)|nr:membrane protease subunit, stomatin/prohibitin [Planctomycetaceae bacterium]HJM58753.1 SPFH domain-containing protein [Planctomycetota bacterium]